MGIYERLAELERNGETAAVATVIHSQGSVPRHEGSKMLIFLDGSIEGTIGGGELESQVIEEALEAMETGRGRVLHYSFRDPDQGDVGVCGGEVDVYVESITSKATVLIVGGGHVGQAVAHLAHWLGFRVVVADDRPEYATPEAVPQADEYIVCPMAELPEHVAVNEDTYVMLTTRGVPVDLEGLPVLLGTPAAYIGVIGSRRRWETTADELRQTGVPPEDIARVKSPMGLELNAETPEEIAVSMMAEIIMLRRGGTGQPMAHDALGKGRRKEAKTA